MLLACSILGVRLSSIRPEFAMCSGQQGVSASLPYPTFSLLTCDSKVEGAGRGAGRGSP